jgi:predicted transcriptional regulator
MTYKQQKLRQIMAEHKLTQLKISYLLKCSKHAVKAWLRPEASEAYREMPEILLDMLEMKLAEQNK